MISTIHIFVHPDNLLNTVVVVLMNSLFVNSYVQPISFDVIHINLYISIYHMSAVLTCLQDNVLVSQQNND